jgi:hypothetical protein
MGFPKERKQGGLVGLNKKLYNQRLTPILG